MSYKVRAITSTDLPFMLEMLFHAAYMQDDGATCIDDVIHNPDLEPYVKDWGRAGDMGFIAADSDDSDNDASRNVGAVWLRLVPSNQRFYGELALHMPELVLAVVPDLIGRGVGTVLLRHLIAAAKTMYPAILLTVRINNPAQKLYARFGFQRIDEVVNRVGTRSYVMKLEFVTS